MTISVISMPGTRLTRQKITPGNTATGLNKATWLLHGNRKNYFTSGGTYVTKRGDIITGATSSATAYVEAVIIETGTMAGGDAAGWIYTRNQSGTFQSENLNVGSNSNVATIATDFSIIHGAVGMAAKKALVIVEDNDIRFSTDGSTPTATAGTRIGDLAEAGQNFPLESTDEIRNFKCIDAVSGNASVVVVECFF